VGYQGGIKGAAQMVTKSGGRRRGWVHSDTQGKRQGQHRRWPRQRKNPGLTPPIHTNVRGQKKKEGKRSRVKTRATKGRKVREDHAAKKNVSDARTMALSARTEGLPCNEPPISRISSMGKDGLPVLVRAYLDRGECSAAHELSGVDFGS